MDRAHESVERLRLSFDVHVDATFTVEHPSGQSAFDGEAIDEGPEADALHDAGMRTCRASFSWPFT